LNTTSRLSARVREGGAPTARKSNPRASRLGDGKPLAELKLLIIGRDLVRPAARHLPIF
jgi:hypothetical protein